MRPAKLTVELQEAIVEKISGGNYPEVSAVSSGIARTTYYRWMARGAKDKDGPYRDFRDAIKKADADGEVGNITSIRKIADGGALIERKTVVRKNGDEEITEKFSSPQWTPLAWIEERRHSLNWGRRDLMELKRLEEEVRQLRKEMDARTSGNTAGNSDVKAEAAEGPNDP